MAEEKHLRLNGYVNRTRDPDLYAALVGMDKALRMGRLRELARLGMRAEAVLRVGTDRRLEEQFASLNAAESPVRGPSEPTQVRPPGRESTQKADEERRPVTAREPDQQTPVLVATSALTQPRESRRAAMLGLIDTSIMR